MLQANVPNVVNQFQKKIMDKKEENFIYSTTFFEVDGSINKLYIEIINDPIEFNITCQEEK